MNLSLDEIRVMIRQYRDEGMWIVDISRELLRFGVRLEPQFVRALLWGSL